MTIPGMAILALAVLAAVPARGDEEQDLVRRVHVAIAGTLNQALERTHGEQALPWNDPATGLAGLITAYPAMARNGQNCRQFKYAVHDALWEVTDTGLYCRDPIGFWTSAGMPEIVATRLLAPEAPPAPPPASPDTRQAAQGGPPPQPPPDQAPAETVRPDPSVLQLQRNLVRLAYAAGPADGLSGPGFEAALQKFQDDEGLPQASDPDAIRRAVAASTATIARSEQGGSCEAPANSQGDTLVCGRRR